MLKIKLYFALTLFIVLVSSITTAFIGIKVAKYRGEKIEKLSRQIEEMNSRTEKFDHILTDYLEGKNEKQKIYNDLKKEVDNCTDDVYLPDAFSGLWESFAASQTCDSGGFNGPL